MSKESQVNETFETVAGFNEARKLLKHQNHPIADASLSTETIIISLGRIMYRFAIKVSKRKIGT
jgi:hypothetical protein